MLKIEIEITNIYGDTKSMYLFAGGFLHSLGQMMIGAASVNFENVLAEQLESNVNSSTDGETKIVVKVKRENPEAI